ncbi:hypothetical protein Aperf_G00000099467 [Anoplocephala perfoliata]
MEGEMIKEALLETGWKSSFAFPTASEENMKLLELLAETKVKINETNEGLLMFKEKNKKLEDHITLVLNERKLTEQLKVEVDKEIADSEHFIKMAEQENWRTASDHKRLINQRKKLTSRISSIEDEIFLKSNELTSIKSELDCGQKLVEQFMADCESDYALKRRLQAISKTDNTLIQRLISEEKKFSAKRSDILKKLDTTVSKNEVLQLRIDTTSEMGREENRGRQEMLHLWEKTVKQLSDRDSDFSKLGKDYDDLLTDINERQSRMHAMQKLLGSILQDIKDVKNRSSLLNADASNLRQIILDETKDSATTENELQTLKKLVTKISRELQQQRASNTHSRKTNNKLSKTLLTTEDSVTTTEKKLENLQMENFSAEETLRMFEDELDSEMQCQETIKIKLNKLKNQMFAIAEERQNAESDKKTFEVLINGSQTKMRYTEREMSSNESELTRLEQLIYKVMQVANSLERRISRMESHPAYDDESRALEKRVHHMQEQYDSQCQSSQALISMIEQFGNEKRILNLQSEKLKEHLKKDSHEMEVVKIYIANVSKNLDCINRSRNELLVFYNLNRYKLRRIEEQCRLMEKSTLSAEVRSKAIVKLTKELEEESAARASKVEAEMRLTGQDTIRIRADLTRRERRLEQLKSRYDTEASKISPDGDVDKAQINIVVKSLEEHGELRARGDELDQEVRKAEEELRALENTVLVMTSLNECARSYSGTTLDPELVRNKEILTQKLDTSAEKLRAAREKRRVFRALILILLMRIIPGEKDNPKLCDSFDLTGEQRLIKSSVAASFRFTVEISSLDEEMAQLKKVVTSYQADITSVKSKNEELDDKLERALKVQTLAKTKASRVKQNLDLDIEVQLLNDFNESVNVLLGRSLKASPFINKEILSKAQELIKGFELPIPILISSVDNIKASDRVFTRNTNASKLSVAKVVDFSATHIFGKAGEKTVPTNIPLKRCTKIKRGGLSRPTSAASSATLSIRSINEGVLG